MNKAQIAAAAGLVLGCSTMSLALAETPPPDSPAAKQEAERLAALPPVAPKGKPAIDPSGRKERGRASFYAPKFAGHTMADGRKMNPNHNVAASKALPLGTTTKVTNLETGKTATVTVQDRGPAVRDRVVDVSPKAAGQLDLKKRGVAPVEVSPIAVPQKDGGVKLGAGAAQASPQEVQRAVETTKALTPRTETKH
jgi:peptidoglycan lytic transglycosylase